MTPIEQKAYDDRRQAYAKRDPRFSPGLLSSVNREKTGVDEAHCRAIEREEALRAEFDAYKKDVSDAVDGYFGGDPKGFALDYFSRFIIQPPVDPLVEIISEAIGEYIMPGAPWDNVRAVLAARGWQCGPIEGDPK